MHERVIPNVRDWPIARIARHQDEILDDVVEESVQHIYLISNGSIRDVIAKALYLERIRIKSDPWDVDPEDEPEFWGKVKKKLSSYDPTTVNKDVAEEVEDNILRDIVRRYSEEIINNFDPKLYWFAQQTLPIFFNRLLNASSGGIRSFMRPKTFLDEKLFITGPVDKIRSLAAKGSIILVPTHLSNLDSIIIGYGMDSIGLPAFQYGAGLNLFNSRLFGYFMGNLGAYKVDRRKKNTIYIETLKAYSRINVYKGANTIFFPGGTRSRSGAIEDNLKLGLVGTIIDAQRMHFENQQVRGQRKIFVVPLTVSYHFVLEATSLISEHLRRTGKEQYLLPDDQFMSYKSLMKFFSGIFASSSEITLSLNDPIDIFGNKVDDEGNSIDKFGRDIDIRKYFVTRGEIKKDAQRDQVYTQMLGDKIVENFKTGNTVYSSHLVAFVAFEILMQRYQDTDLFTVLRTPEEEREISWDEFVFACCRVRDELYHLNNNHKVKIAPHMTYDMDEVIEQAIKNINTYHAVRPIYRNKQGNISSEDLKLLYFYHNRLEGYGLHKFI